MNIHSRGVRRIFLSDWFVALILLSVFLLTTGYIYGWDDQHVEIPLLKNLIDPGLYAGDYYVESLKKNFTSFFYPLLAGLITVEQIPAVYFILYLLSRYFLLFWIYKIWRLIARERFTAFLCALSGILLFRIDDFFYRTFSHQEFALAIVFAGLYFFYKGRYRLAAAVFGATADFHALYGFFPFLYMMVYLAWSKTSWKNLLITSGICALFALPVIIWTVSGQFLARETFSLPKEEWLKIYYIVNPHSFLSSMDLKGLADPAVLLKALHPYLLPAVFFILNALYLPRFLKARKTLSIILTGWTLIIIYFIWIYFFPMKIAINLNLFRSNQFIHFFLTGYLIILLVKLFQEKRFLVSSLLALTLPLLRLGHYIDILAGVSLIFFLASENSWNKGRKPAAAIQALFSLACLTGAVVIFARLGFSLPIHLFLYSYYTAAAVIGVVYLFLRRKELSFLFLAAFMLTSAVSWTYLHYRHFTLRKDGEGFWQLQNAWIDMQNFVRENTPKDALILVPYDMQMGGFRIFSERKILFCQRDSGIVGFDFSAAVEWKKRMDRMIGFHLMVDHPPRAFSAAALAILEYKVNYIVFVKYLDPYIPFGAVLRKHYENDLFVLYEVRINPVEKN